MELSPDRSNLVVRGLEPRDSGTISCIVSTSIDTLRLAGQGTAQGLGHYLLHRLHQH
jgi:hypothetical protein